MARKLLILASREPIPDRLLEGSRCLLNSPFPEPARWVVRVSSCFGGTDKLVHLIEAGEVVPGLRRQRLFLHGFCSLLDLQFQIRSARPLHLTEFTGARQFRNLRCRSGYGRMLGCIRLWIVEQVYD